MFLLNTLAVALLLGLLIGTVGGILGVPHVVLMGVGFFVGLQAPRIVKALSEKKETPK